LCLWYTGLEALVHECVSYMRTQEEYCSFDWSRNQGLATIIPWAHNWPNLCLYVVIRWKCRLVSQIRWKSLVKQFCGTNCVPRIPLLKIPYLRILLESIWNSRKFSFYIHHFTPFQ
jgi:hypothetical protein